jgi:hypothetical protein
MSTEHVARDDRHGPCANDGATSCCGLEALDDLAKP